MHESCAKERKQKSSIQLEASNTRIRICWYGRVCVRISDNAAYMIKSTATFFRTTNTNTCTRSRCMYRHRHTLLSQRTVPQYEPRTLCSKENNNNNNNTRSFPTHTHALKTDHSTYRIRIKKYAHTLMVSAFFGQPSLFGCNDRR